MVGGWWICSWNMSSSLPSLSTSSTEPSTSCHSAILHCRLLTLAAINTQVKDNKSHIQWSDRQTDRRTHTLSWRLTHSFTRRRPSQYILLYAKKNVGFCSLGFLLRPSIHLFSQSLTHSLTSLFPGLSFFLCRVMMMGGSWWLWWWWWRCRCHCCGPGVCFGCCICGASSFHSQVIQVINFRDPTRFFFCFLVPCHSSESLLLPLNLEELEVAFDWCSTKTTFAVSCCPSFFLSFHCHF